jgi:hypothetical protein
MPKAPAKIRRRYVEGTTNVCPWDVEECLVFGCPEVFGPPCLWRTLDEWSREWSRWRSVIEPKVREYLPGRRAFAQYVVGEIPRRELLLPVPEPNGWWFVDVASRDGSVVSHPINVPEPFVRPQWKHLRDLGLLEPDELQRYRAWLKRGKFDTYALEMACFQ